MVEIQMSVIIPDEDYDEFLQELGEKGRVLVEYATYTGTSIIELKKVN